MFDPSVSKPITSIVFLETDDMDFGIRVNRRIHRLPTKDEVADGEFGEDELVEDWDLEGYWLLSRMQFIHYLEKNPYVTTLS